MGEEKERSPFVQDQVKKLHEDASKFDFSGKSGEELEAITEGRSAAKGSDGVDAVGPGFMDVLTGGARLDWHTGDYEFNRSTAKPAKGWEEAQKGRAAAPSINGDEGKGGSGATSGGIGGIGGTPIITTADVREFKDLVKEIRDLLKEKKKTGDQQQGNQNSGFGSALPPKPTLLPNSVPPLKGTGK